MVMLRPKTADTTKDPLIKPFSQLCSQGPFSLFLNSFPEQEMQRKGPENEVAFLRGFIMVVFLLCVRLKWCMHGCTSGPDFLFLFVCLFVLFVSLFVC